MAPLGIALIGSGIFMKEQHVPAALACPLVEIKAVWSRSSKSAEETAKLVGAESGVQVYSSDSGTGKTYDDLLERSDISALIIALPIVDQPSFIEKGLAAGKHILAEKPIAKDVETAVKLIQYYKKVSAETKATLAIAENFRFFESFKYAAERIRQLGNMTGFVVRIGSMMDTGNKYYNTAWRTVPEYQGGFLLDGGVHNTAALRELLGNEHSVSSLIAHTSLVSSHLPPVDSINAIIQTKSGVIGSYIHSAGTAMSAHEYLVSCENGYVKVEPDKVTTVIGIGADATPTERLWKRTSGVHEEVKAWAEALVSGQPNPRQSPELALGDLELMEKMLTSGDHAGERQQLQFQYFV
ncbi:NAD(P)-binding protein [Xylariaceae sp. FL1019]|nr:NAD(P)-binding protein [Xylariaceae sp. FL1019]